MTRTVFKVTGPNGEAHIANNGFEWPLPIATAEDANEMPE